MYSYTWDEETGGLLLNSSELRLSKEPRPVYSQELDLLGFNQYWDYDKEDTAPIMWAEANNYIYRSKLVAQTKGGAPFRKPEVIILEKPEETGAKLRSVDLGLMSERNHSIIEHLENETIKHIQQVYEKYLDKVDVFYVAFSGGKDSILALDLVQRALPHNDFFVLFGDTKMEFPDTYQTIEKAKEFCENENIRFFSASSRYEPEDTWNVFGPPAQRIRWCCSVHKTTPQILLLRKITGKPNFRGMAFTGIRGAESASRSAYEDISLGEKVRGQYSCHPILEWGAAELYAYTFYRHLFINPAYKKGNSRAGCLVCPLAGYKNMWFKEQNYGQSVSLERTTTTFNNIIKDTSAKEFATQEAEEEFMNIAGWKARRSGRELSFPKMVMDEVEEDGKLIVKISKTDCSWKEWLKTVGHYSIKDNRNIQLEWDGNLYTIEYIQQNKELFFSLHAGNSKSDILLKKAFKIVMRKSAYCVGCQVCEANCPYGYISMTRDFTYVDDKCVKCHRCHDIDNGCLLYSSIKLPKKENKMGSINRYGNMGVEYDWIKQYFNTEDEKKVDFLKTDTNPTLGTKMVKNLASFLSDGGIVNKRNLTNFGLVVQKLGLERPETWGLILCNLAYTSQFNWWINTIDFGTSYDIESLQALFTEETGNTKTHIISAFKNILSSNPYLSESVGLGICDSYVKNGKTYLNSVVRSPWKNPSPEVILYCLFKFAEACGDYKQFTLTRLMDSDIESDGITPTQIFGLDKDTMTAVLNGLSANYPEFIHVSFTLDLDNISLSDDKTSKDVLDLFK